MHLLSSTTTSLLANPVSPSSMTHHNPFFPGAPVHESPNASASLEWYAHSVSGTKKPINDDSWLGFAADIHGANLLESTGTHSLASKDIIFAVSDGMGGGNAGDAASQLLLKCLSEQIPETFKTAASGMHPDYLFHLNKAIREVHQSINATAAKDSAKKGMAATLTLAWFTPENLYLANVGDSRLYLFRETADPAKNLQQLTHDHTFAWRQMNRGDITERQYRAHPRRSALYEVVGGGHDSVNPYLAAIPYSDRDRFLLCSDGLVDGLWQKHIDEAFSENTDSTTALAKSLMSRAIENDGADDITLITLAVNNTDR